MYDLMFGFFLLFSNDVDITCFIEPRLSIYTFLTLISQTSILFINR